MGEIAEDILEGLFCQCCGEFMGDYCGYPRTCEDCEAEEQEYKKRKKHPAKKDKTWNKKK